MPSYSYELVNHAYRIDGRTIPSVTGIQKAANLSTDFSFADRVHAFRGGAVHHGAAIIDQGGEPEVSGPPQYSQIVTDIRDGYWPAFRAFKAATGFQGYIYECPMIHPTLEYGGTFDMLGLCGDEVWMPDLKSGTLPPLTCVQLAGYEMLIREGVPVNEDHPGLAWLRDVVERGLPIRKKAVQLNKDGTFKLFHETHKGESYDLPLWRTVWQSALNTYRIRARYGLLASNG